MNENRWPVLYVKTAGGSINCWQVWTEGSSVCMRWGQIGGQMQESRTPAEPKNIGRSNETSAEEQAIKEAEARFKKQKRLKYVDSFEEAQSNVNIKPMRAYTLDEKRQKKLTFPATAQPKFDGCRTMAYMKPDGTIRLMSRGGLDYELEHVAQQLHGRIPEGWCLDGELYCHGMSLQTIRHHIETYSEESLQIYMVCYDIFHFSALEASWNSRHHALRKFFQANQGLQHIRMTPSLVVESMQDVDDLHATWVGQGYEGLILRLHEGPYRLAAKSTHLLKYKQFDDEEFKIVDWSTGKDGIIQYTCVQEDGKRFEARPMGTAEERARLLEQAKSGSVTGKLLTVRYMGRSDDNIPLHPRGVAIRPAKDL